MRWGLVCVYCTCLLGILPGTFSAKKGVKSLVEPISDSKELKKLLRTKNNVLLVYSKKTDSTSSIKSLLDEVSIEVKGLATIATIDCSSKEGKKTCKKMKVDAEKYVIKHYKDGDFHKDYDRSENFKSMTTFLKDPTGDLPWEEDPTAQDVVHLTSPAHLSKLLKQEAGPILIMFYAPWCGHCKRLKPDYQTLASQKTGDAILAAMDVNSPNNSPISRKYNITGYPTLLYFEKGKLMFPYQGGNNKDEISKFLDAPSAQPPEKPKEVSWQDEPSEVHHLTDDTFDKFMQENPSVLVMFYAPWCGHCKRAKPHFVSAAGKLAKDGAGGKLAAVDCTKETKLGSRFEVKGFPTIKYFKDGEVAFDAGHAREEKEILKFMEDPSEPPAPPPPEPAWSDQPSHVVHLDEEAYKPFLKKKKHVLVMFYAPWCGHCKQAKPHYVQAADYFKDNGKVELAAVDCTIERSLCSVNQVQGFPTFIYFNYYKNKKDYDGGRSAKDFIKFLQDPEGKVEAPAPPPVESPEEQWKSVPGNLYIKHLNGKDFDHFMRYKDTVLVMFYAPWCGHCKAMKPDFAKAAVDLTEAKVAHVLATVDCTQEMELCNRFGVRGYPTLKLFRRGSEVETYSGGRKSPDIFSYVAEKAKQMRNEL